MTGFCKSISQVLRGRFQTFLSSPLVATDSLPPVNIIKDKFTYHHWTRQLVGLVTLSPGSKQLIKAVFLAAPKCPKGDGEYLKDNIVSVTDRYIKPEQFVGSSGDRVYNDTKVGEKLDQHYGVESNQLQLWTLTLGRCQRFSLPQGMCASWC